MLTELCPLFEFGIFPTFELHDLEDWFQYTDSIWNANHFNEGKVPLHSLLVEWFTFLGSINSY